MYNYICQAICYTRQNNYDEAVKMLKKSYAIVGKPIDFSEYYNVKFNDEV